MLSVADNASGSPQNVSLGGSTVPSALPPARSRTNYIRTDAVTEYVGYNSNWEVYDPGTRRFFVADPDGNRVDVLDARSESLLAAVVVPGALSIDVTPDHRTVWVATIQGDLYTLDPSSLAVTARYPSSQIGPYGYPTAGVHVLASGKLVLLGGPVTIDGALGFAVWDPKSNAIVFYGSAPFGSGAPALPNCVAIGAFTLTGDRKKVVEGSILSDGTLCVLDPDTGSYITAASGREFVVSVFPTPDGRSILLPVANNNGNAVTVFDAATLNPTGTFPILGDTSSAASMLVSPDSKTLWMTTFGGGDGELLAYDLASGNLKGWTPSPYVPSESSGYAMGPFDVPALDAMDETGLIAGPMEEGVGFIDTAAIQPGTPPLGYVKVYLTPATGSVSGGVQTTWGGTAASPLTSVYFGSAKAPQFSEVGNGQFSATTPAAAKGGPVNVYSLTANGNEQIVPDGFSYGPTILEVTPNASVAAGGGAGVVYGYGFGPILAQTIPSDLQVTVGGKPVVITGFSSAYGSGSSPFPLQTVAFRMPAGTLGSTADLVVTTPSGSARARAAVSYLPDISTYPLPGAALAQGVYDPLRDVYYFTDAARIQVFSRTLAKWLTPIAVPAAPAGLTHRLWGIALSADGSKLAVADPGAQMLYLLNPGSPATVKSFPVLPYFAGSPYTYPGLYAEPIAVAVTNAGVLYYTTTGMGDLDGFFKLDSVTGKIVDYRLGGDDQGETRLALTADESLLFFNCDSGVYGSPVVLDTATDIVFYGQNTGGVLDLALSADQQQVAFPGTVYDSSYNVLDYLTLNDREVLDTEWVFGMKLSPDGSLLFQPGVAGLDVFDTHTGLLWTRLALPVVLGERYDALVGDGTDNVLVAITGAGGTGVAVVDLSGLAEPALRPFSASTPAPRPFDAPWLF
ncbi:MAG: hypothetical protein WCE75_10475, partial [Terracidiphilus sp.]